MPDRIARLAVLLGLVPAILGLVGSILVTLDQLKPAIDNLAPVVRDPYQFTFIVASTALVFAVVFLWRRYVRWTPARTAATIAWTALLFGQLLCWCPIVKLQGCGKNDALIAGQSTTTAGLWCIGCALTWWSFAFRRHNRARSPLPAGGKRMTPDVARIAYGMALLPLLFGIWWMSIVLLPEIVSAQNSPWPEYLSLELVTLVAVIVWVLVWRTRVEWTPSRRLGTWVLALVLLAAPAQQFLPTDVFSDGSLQLMIRIARASTWLFVLGLWFMGTAWLWRMRNDSSVHTNQRPEVRCPQCDYSLTGLCEVRCPECNWSSTIDEIARLALDSAASA